MSFSVSHDSLPLLGKKHLGRLQATCDGEEEKRWHHVPHVTRTLHMFEMWSQAKQVTETQEGQHVFYSSPKYNLKPPNEGRFC